jgi:hypothetical protein
MSKSPHIAPAKSKRRRIQFSIAALLMLITAVGAGMGYLTWAPRRQREAVETVQSLGGTVVRENDVRPTADPFGGPPPPSAAPKTEPGVAERIRELLGIENPAQVVHVSLRERRVTDEDLQLLANFPELQSLDLSYTPITDAGLAYVGILTQLRALNLEQTKIGDHGLAHLRGLKNLIQLTLSKTDVSDDGMAHVGQMRELKILAIDRTRVRGAGLEHLAGHPELFELVAGEIEEKHLGQLANLPQLQFLAIGLGEASDDAIADLQALKSLRGLRLLEAGTDGSDLATLKASLPYEVSQ